MTNIQYLKDRIIIDGHANTKQECETITLLCDNLAKSKDFKTVRYESGYAEFEKVGKTNDLKFASASDNLTWVINKTPDGSIETPFTDLNYTSNNETFHGMGIFTNSIYYNYDSIGSEQIKVYSKTTGWVNETYRTITFIKEPTDETLIEWLQANATQATPTTKQQIDLSTLSGWANLSSGQHSITVKTKASGYTDSASSNVVTVEKAASGYTVTVTAASNGFDIHDGQSTSGTKLGTIGDGGTINVVCSSGYLYFSTPDYGSITSVTGGVTIVNDYTVKVTGDGTVSANYECLIEGTQITLADGTTKAIEDITYDDELLVWNFYEGKFDVAKPTWIKVAEVAPRYNLVKFSNGVEIGFVGSGGEKGYHRIFNKEAGAFTHTGCKDTPNGTTTFAQDETFPTVVSQEVVEKEVKFYNVITDKHYNLFANGILTSCKLSNKYYIKDMKYVGEKLISEEEKEVYFETIKSKDNKFNKK